MKSLSASRSSAAALAALLAASTGSAAVAAELTATEARWLQGIAPVLAYARQARLPLDIIVQPQPAPGASPLALAFVEGRCKLVFSMRGNPLAQATLDAVEPALLPATLELVAAHELGHCRRWLDGAWYHLPAGFTANAPGTLPSSQRAAYLDMQSTRREEGYGDLVGLAWTQQHHPQHYARLHAWLLTERTTDRIPGSHHDTLAWLRLAQSGVPGAETSIFAGPASLWAAGLGVED